MKRLAVLFLILTMMLGMVACSLPAAAEPEAADALVTEAPTIESIQTEPEHCDLIGISVPTNASGKWNEAGENMKAMLEMLGYEVDLRFGNDSDSLRSSQQKELIDAGCKVLIVLHDDGSTLDVLAEAINAGIAVVAYDPMNPMFMGKDCYTCFVDYDLWAVGTKQGQYIVDALDLNNVVDQSFNIEFCYGSVMDEFFTSVFYRGAMEVLEPYIRFGVLRTPSGQSESGSAGTNNGTTEEEQARFEEILTEYYSDNKTLDAVLAVDDATAMGAVLALDQIYEGDFPIVTGFSCRMDSLHSILAGKQTMSAYWDDHDLQAKTVEIADALARGEDPGYNKTGEPPEGRMWLCENDISGVPSYQIEPRVCTAENMREYMVDGGYYTADELGMKP